jgi:hypothetical protein
MASCLWPRLVSLLGFQVRSSSKIYCSTLFYVLLHELYVRSLLFKQVAKIIFLKFSCIGNVIGSLYHGGLLEFLQKFVEVF